MSYFAMSNKDLSQLIRKTLKQAGYTNKDCSVRIRSSSYDTAVNIRIKNPFVRISEIEKITRQFEEIERDERTQEILSGCNVYVHCGYEYGIFDEICQPLMVTSEKVLHDEKYDGRRIAKNTKKEIHIIRINSTESRLYECAESEGQIPSKYYILHSAKDLAVAMWRFKNLGTIYA